MAPLTAVLTIFKRDMKLALSYRFDFVIRTFSSLFSVVLWYYLSRVLRPDPSVTGTGDYFTYVIVGMSLLGYINVTLFTFSQKIRQDQLAGTLEFIIASPVSPSVLLFSSALWEMVLETFHFCVFMAFAALFGASFNIGSLAALAAVFFLTLAGFGSLGIIAASFLLVFKRGEPITPFVTAFFALLGNIFFPAAVLPPALKAVSLALPLPYAVEALRMVLTKGAVFADVMKEINALALFAVILVPAAILSLELSLRVARRYGLLSMY